MASVPAAVWADLESTLDPTPEFFVQAPDGRKDWAEISRQATLFRLVHLAGPRVMGEAIPNAGKRNPLQARREGIVAGVFDTVWRWRAPLVAHIEMKGFDKSGRPGRLSRQQIEWGNRMVSLDYNVACFFDPYAAVEWLRGLGFPISQLKERLA